jgi:valyl-tRNA synthetase
VSDKSRFPFLDFANKAPAALVQKERDKLAGYKETAGKIKAQLK